MAALWDGSNCSSLVSFGAKGFSTALSADRIVSGVDSSSEQEAWSLANQYILDPVVVSIHVLASPIVNHYLHIYSIRVIRVWNETEQHVRRKERNLKFMR
jgi:hypothetical protein